MCAHICMWACLCQWASGKLRICFSSTLCVLGLKFSLLSHPFGPHQCSCLPGPSCRILLLEALALLRRLYLWVAHITTLTSWNLAYLVTWTTCLASHLLQAAFEHTAQLAQAQETKSQETSGPPPRLSS